VIGIALALAACRPESPDPNAWPPNECALDSSPFLQPQCLDALATKCGMQASEAACVAVEEAPFDEYPIQCTWIDVTVFSDAAACTVQSVDGRCVAVLLEEDCVDGCQVDAARGEILDLCGGPLDASSAVGAEDPGPAPCSSATPPALCACSSTVCPDH
jgi:hypothetical protein